MPVKPLQCRLVVLHPHPSAQLLFRHPTKFKFVVLDRPQRFHSAKRQNTRSGKCVPELFPHQHLASQSTIHSRFCRTRTCANCSFSVCVNLEPFVRPTDDALSLMDAINVCRFCALEAAAPEPTPCCSCSCSFLCRRALFRALYS